MARKIGINFMIDFDLSKRPQFQSALYYGYGLLRKYDNHFVKLYVTILETYLTSSVRTFCDSLTF